MLLHRHVESNVMKKVLTLVMTLALLASLAVMPVNAANYFEVLKGTPVIDGQIDDMYLASACISPDTTSNIALNNSGWGQGATNTVDTSYTYFLWDDTGLYIACMVYDKTINQFTYDQCYNGSDGPVDELASYGDLYMGCFMTPTGDYFKVSVDAFATFISAQEDAKNYFDIDNAKYASTVADGEGYYVVEVYLPIVDGAEEDTQILYHTMIANAGRKIEKGGFRSSFGSCFAGDTLLFVGTTASGDDTTAAPATDTTAAPADDTTAAPADDTTAAPADDTTAAPADDTTAAPADDTTAAPETSANSGSTTDASQTADVVVVLAVVALCAAAALIIISKKRTA